MCGGSNLIFLYVQKIPGKGFAKRRRRKQLCVCDVYAISEAQPEMSDMKTTVISMFRTLKRKELEKGQPMIS